MKIKGKATLILKNAATGKIEKIISQENTITQALQKIINSNIAGCLDYNKILPIKDELLGGVCLFNGTLDASKIFLPKQEDATLTAHAGQHTYASASADPKRGNPNTAVSGPVENGWLFAYEWGQTQGVGRITHIALTHSDTGDYWNESTPNSMAGHGSPSDADYEKGFTPVERTDSKVITPEDFYYEFEGVEFPRIHDQERIPVGFYGDKNHVLTISQETASIVKIHISKFTGTGMWIWNSLGEVKDERTINVSVSSGYNYIVYDQEEKELYLFNASSQDGQFSETLTGKKVDLETGTATTWTVDCSAAISGHGEFKNWDGQTITDTYGVYCRGVDNQNCHRQLQVIDGCIFVPIYWYHDRFVHGPTNCSIKINLASTGSQEIIEDFYQWEGGGYIKGQTQIHLGNGRFMNPQCMAWKDSNGDYKAQAILYDDASSGLFPSYFLFSRAFCAEQPEENPVQFFTYVDGNATSGRGTVLNKLYQATVCALEEPVTKTGSQTMTLLYTITQTVEDEEQEEETPET